MTAEPGRSVHGGHLGAPAEPTDREETLEEWARRIAAEAPPPDQAMLDRLAVLLAPGGDHA